MFPAMFLSNFVNNKSVVVSMAIDVCATVLFSGRYLQALGIIPPLKRLSSYVANSLDAASNSCIIALWID